MEQLFLDIDDIPGLPLTLKQGGVPALRKFCEVLRQVSWVKLIEEQKAAEQRKLEELRLAEQKRAEEWAKDPSLKYQGLLKYSTRLKIDVETPAYWFVEIFKNIARETTSRFSTKRSIDNFGVYMNDPIPTLLGDFWGLDKEERNHWCQIVEKEFHLHKGSLSSNKLPYTVQSLIYYLKTQMI